VNLEDYRVLFMVATLGLALIVAAPTLSLVVPIRSGSAKFSELWLLGPTHMLEGYPFNVGVGGEYSVFVGVGNHMGCSEYYLVYVKFRNQTQPPPDASSSKPSPLPPLYEFQFFVADGKTWESLLVFKILDASVQGNSMFVGNVSINGVAFPVNSFSNWDSEHNGFYYQLFFELWLYNMTTQSFQYNNRFVGIWLNVTAS
jgi:hypothetical protein